MKSKSQTKYKKDLIKNNGIWYYLFFYLPCHRKYLREKRKKKKQELKELKKLSKEFSRKLRPEKDFYK